MDLTLAVLIGVLAAFMCGTVILIVDRIAVVAIEKARMEHERRTDDETDEE